MPRPADHHTLTCEPCGAVVGCANKRIAEPTIELFYAAHEGEGHEVTETIADEGAGPTDT